MRELHLRAERDAREHGCEDGPAPCNYRQCLPLPFREPMVEERKHDTGDERQAVGLAEVTSAAYPDPQLNDPKLVVVDIKPLRRLAQGRYTATQGKT